MRERGLTAQRRKAYVDAIRGFCILLVLASHAGGVPVLGPVLLSSYMGVFFILAGYVYREHSGEDFRRFMGRKAKRLLVPYFTYAVAILILDALFERLSPAEVIRGGLGILYARHHIFRADGEEASKLLPNGSGQLWFLAALFLACGAFWILKESGRGRKWLLGLCACAAVALYRLPVLLPWSLDTVVVTGPLMYFGHWLRQFENRIEDFRFRKLADVRGLLVAVAACGAYVWLSLADRGINLSIGEYGKPGAWGVFMYAAIAMLGATIYLFAFSGMENAGFWDGLMRALSGLGRRTVTLLGTHMMVYGFMDTFLAARIPTSLAPVYELAKIAAALLVGIVANAIFQRLGKRIALFKYM